MNENDKIILEQILDEQRLEHAPSASKSEFFEIFVAEQTLKDHDLGYDELEAGIVDGCHDGGIDAMYVLVNGEVALDDFDFSSLKKNVLIETVLIQAKTSETFRENALEKMTATAEDIFDLGKASIRCKTFITRACGLRQITFGEYTKDLPLNSPR